MAPSGWILTLNAGSSSLKYAAYDALGETALTSGQVGGIGGEAFLRLGEDRRTFNARNHGDALEVALSSLRQQNGLDGEPRAVGHRIVHGGQRSLPCVISEKVHKEIEQLSSLAPLHNPPALRTINRIGELFPEVVQVACFDTAFHADNPAEATTIALPKRFREAGIKRYGFHGLSYSSLVRRFEKEIGQAIPKRLLAFHLGAGASLAAIVEGKSVATSMGFSPLEGLVMATRAGSLDPGILLHLMKQGEMSVDELENMLNTQCGLSALSEGETDMKKLLQATDNESQFAVSHYIYWVVRHAGSMIAAMGGVDGFVFTGGIGENAAAVRQRILHDLTWAGATKANSFVIRADEEGEIAHSAARFL